jgi:hypothetical protein
MKTHKLFERVRRPGNRAILPGIFVAASSSLQAQLGTQNSKLK